MASELRLLGAATGTAVYAVISRDSDELVWNGTGFEARVNANHATYKVAMAETPAGARIWLGDFPAGISDDGTVLYSIDYYLQAGGEAAHTDEILGGETMYSDGSGGNSTPATTTLISVAEYDAAVENDLGASAKALMIQAATAAIEKYCGTKLVRETDRVEVLDGTGFGFVQLGGVPSTVTSVRLGHNTADPQDVDGSNFAWTESGLLYVKPTCTEMRTFAAGFQNVRVTYTTAGTVEYDLKLACMLVVQAMARMTDPDALVSSKSVKDVTIKYGAGVYVDLENPLFGEAKALLAPYKQLLCI